MSKFIVMALVGTFMFTLKDLIARPFGTAVIEYLVCSAMVLGVLGFLKGIFWLGDALERRAQHAYWRKHYSGGDGL